MNKHMMSLVLLLLCLIVPLTSKSHQNFSSSSFIGQDDVIANGGGPAAATSYRNHTSVGQSAQGSASSTSFIIHAGYLHPLLQTPTDTPSITITSTSTTTPTITATSSITPPFTFTTTPTTTVTATITPTLTISATQTASATCTITATQTASRTISPTATITPTNQVWLGDDIIFFPQPAVIGQPSWIQVQHRGSTEWDVVISVYNILGEQVFSLKERGIVGLSRIPITTDKLAPGIYYYQVMINQDKQSVRKMVLIK